MRFMQWQSKIKGLQMVEIIVAAMLFLVFTIPFLSLLSTSKYTNKRQGNKFQALMLAQGALDEMHHNTREYSSTMNRLVTVTPAGFKIRRLFQTPQGLPEGLLLLKVEVSYEEFKKKKVLELSRIVSTARSFYQYPKRR